MAAGGSPGGGGGGDGRVVSVAVLQHESDEVSLRAINHASARTLVATTEQGAVQLDVDAVRALDGGAGDAEARARVCTLAAPLVDDLFTCCNGTLVSVGESDWMLGDGSGGQRDTLVRTTALEILRRIGHLSGGTTTYALALSAVEVHNNALYELVYGNEAVPQSGTQENSPHGVEAALLDRLALPDVQVQQPGDVDDALALFVLNARGGGRGGGGGSAPHRRSHIVVRFSLLVSTAQDAQDADGGSPGGNAADGYGASSVVGRLPKPHAGGGGGGRTVYATERYTLTVVVLAAYDDARVTTRDQKEVNRSLSSLSHVIDKLNGERSSETFSARAFHLSTLLFDALTRDAHVYFVGHINTSFQRLGVSLWTLSLISAARKLNASAEVRSHVRRHSRSPAKQARSRHGSPEKNAAASAIGGGGGAAVERQHESRAALEDELTQLKNRVKVLSSMNTVLVEERGGDTARIAGASGGASGGGGGARSFYDDVPARTRMSMDEIGGATTNTSATADTRDASGGGGGGAVRHALVDAHNKQIALVQAHAAELVAMQDALQAEADDKAAMEAEFRAAMRKERERRTRLAKKHEAALDALETKDGEIARLQALCTKLSESRRSKVTALEKVVKSRNEAHKRRLRTMEEAFAAQNEELKAVQAELADAMERAQQAYASGGGGGGGDGGFAASDPLAVSQGGAGAAAASAGAAAAAVTTGGDDDAVMMRRLQELVAAQAQQLKTLALKLRAFEESAPAGPQALARYMDGWKAEMEIVRLKLAAALERVHDGVRDGDLRDVLLGTVAELRQKASLPVDEMTAALGAMQQEWERKMMKQSASVSDGGGVTAAQLQAELEHDMDYVRVINVVDLNIKSSLDAFVRSFDEMLGDVGAALGADGGAGVAGGIRFDNRLQYMHDDLKRCRETLARFDAKQSNEPDVTLTLALMQSLRVLFAHQNTLLDQMAAALSLSGGQSNVSAINNSGGAGGAGQQASNNNNSTGGGGGSANVSGVLAGGINLESFIDGVED